EAKKIESNFAGAKKEAPKKDTPVIIRREVVRVEDDLPAQEVKKEHTKKPEVGFVEKDRKTDFNIVYRNKAAKPLSIDELFGKKEKPQTAPETDVEAPEVDNKEEAEEVTPQVNKSESTPRPVNNQERPVNNQGPRPSDRPYNRDGNAGYNNNRPYNRDGNTGYNNNRPFNRDGNTGYNNNRPYNRDGNTGYNNNRPYNRDGNTGYNNNNNRPFNRDGNTGYNNNNRPFNRDGNTGYNNNNRPYNRDGNTGYNNNNNRPFNRDGNTGYNNNRPFNNNRGQDNRFSNNNYNNRGQGRALDDRGIEKNIKNIISDDIMEKQNVREFATRSIDKQKNNSKYDDKTAKKNPRARKGNFEEINSKKLKGLKQENQLSNMFEEGSMLDYYDLTTARGKRSRRRMVVGEERVKQKIFKLEEVTIPEDISVKDLATELKKTSSEIIKKLLGYGIMATINNAVDFDTAFLIAEEFGVKAIKKEVITDEEILFDDSEDREEDLQARPPVIVVMGHVDHGKTSLLDAVRETNVIEGEAGGITQHIGAYKVEINDREITFLDTPGHEAFTSMRARGAQITDIAILVVAANDGVMPQTIEAINHAKAAGIPIIVAVNKIDLEGANPDKVKQELMEHELVPEEWGGDTIFVNISAKQRMNIDSLLEMVLLVADMKEMKANPKKQAKGVVIEAKLDKTKGPVATMLVQRGTLSAGATVLVGSVIGRVRTMSDYKGKTVKKALPSTPVEITGLTSVPEAGETFYVVKDEKTAKHLIETRKRTEREKALNATSKVTLDDLFSQISQGNLKQLNIIVKADVQGTVEAVKSSLEKLSNDEVKVKVIHASAGAVTESDVTLANVANAIIIAFNVRPEPIAKDIAEKNEVEIKTYSVIYHAIEDVESAMKGMLDPVYKEVVIGNVEVRQIFKVSNVGTIAGCYVTTGKVARNAGVRVLRDNVVIHEGKLISLKRMKDDAKEVASGYECGIQLENYNDIIEGDIIEAFIMEEVKQ
ncbi:MAG: translation initiation factor IF-2, partial [Oscillospiraceae bacterium]|nr:translation initiation factor IF-2 [Oscillospiraceae bacterium]